jgi:hypothetical protein
MKTISQLFIAVMFTAIAFSSCKKSSDNSNSSSNASMKFTANGTAVSYNTCIVVDATAGTVKQTLISGNNGTITKPGDATFELDILHDLATLKAGQTYPVSTTFNQANSAALIYFPNQNDFFATQPGNPQGTVSITDVTTDIIKGTFSGKLFTQDDFDGTTVKYTITGGTFVATRPK